MSSKREATLIAGDGIGPEITQATLQVLDALGVSFDWDEQYGGMAAVDKAGYSASPRINRGAASAGATPSRMSARRSGPIRSTR